MQQFPRLAMTALMVALATVPLATAGRVPMPGEHDKVVPTFGTVHYTDWFRGGETAVVRVKGDGDSDLDLYVYDENGNLVGADRDSTDNCLVIWKPRWTGKFTIKVVNCGPMANRYQLRTN
jgi:hypothetical protein